MYPDREKVEMAEINEGANLPSWRSGEKNHPGRMCEAGEK